MAAAVTGCCVDCRFEGPALFRAVIIFENNLLPVPFPFSSLPSPGVPGTLEDMMMSRVVQGRWSKKTVPEDREI